MYRKMVLALVIVCVLGFSASSVVPAAAENMSAAEQIKAGRGLIGMYYNGDDFSEPETGMIDLLPTINYDWGGSRGGDWSARWWGFIEGPVTGQVTLIAEARDGLRLTVGDKIVIDSLTEAGQHSCSVNMSKGKKVPIKLELTSNNKEALLRLYWQWPGQQKQLVPASALSHSTSNLPKKFMVFDFNKRPSQEDEGKNKGDQVLDFLPRFTGGQPPYANTDYLDGQLRPVVGVHNFEVIRCNRTHPELVTEKVPNFPDAGFVNTGFTYNHQPMICYWHGKFWVIYESGPVHEHQPPCYALITWSEDGRNWHKPQTIFPAEKFRNRQEDDKVQYSISHQRMNWYVAPDGRLIAVGFHGMHPSPNNGKGIGRVVREIKGPGEYGPIYWVRYNSYQRYNKDNSPHYPFYKEAPDKGFVRAIDSFLANKLMMQQCYEEDGDKKSGFFALSDYKTRYLKAFCWYTLPDKRIVGMWKWRKMVVADEWAPGHISKQGSGKDIYYGGAKIWGQRTSDGRYALVYNPVKDTRWRHPLSVTTSDDGLNFDTYFLNVQGETPPMRFGGKNKDGGGAQYVRGIVPGNGTPPDGAIWLTYSSNKEDIRVSRVPVPIRGTVDKDVKDTFDNMTVGGIVTDWCVYTGIWTPVAVVKARRNKVLRLADRDPYDYAKAVRVFPETTKARISFRLRPHQKGYGDLEIEVLNYKGQRPVRIKIDGKTNKILANKGANMVEVASFKARKWLKFNISVDTAAGKYDLILNKKKIVSGASFAEALSNAGNPYKSKFSTPTVERIVFRTGVYRLNDFSRYGEGGSKYLTDKPDLPNADEAVDNAVFDIDDFRTATIKANN